MKESVSTGVYVGVLLSAVGVLAWVSGKPFVFPSLGPSALVLALDKNEGYGEVAVGHLIGVVFGFVFYHSLASGIVLTSGIETLSLDGLRLAASGVLAVSLTSIGMVSTDNIHPPACATTLILALGILVTPVEGGVIMVSVLSMLAVDHLINFSPL